MTNSELLPRDQAAAYLGVQAQTLAAWASTRRYPLRFIKVGRLVRYRKSDLDDFLARRLLVRPDTIRRRVRGAWPMGKWPPFWPRAPPYARTDGRCGGWRLRVIHQTQGCHFVRAARHACILATGFNPWKASVGPPLFSYPQAPLRGD